jgi:hypothetical protein
MEEMLARPGAEAALRSAVDYESATVIVTDCMSDSEGPDVEQPAEVIASNVVHAVDAAAVSGGYLAMLENLPRRLASTSSNATTTDRMLIAVNPSLVSK